MTLYEITNALLATAKKVPNINYVGTGDIYELNDKPNIDYGVFYITQINHTQGENTIDYTLTLFYVDRVMKDGSNKLAIQSNGITTIGNIINLFLNTYDDVEVRYDIQYTTFLQRFADECSGVFANVTFSVDNNIGICGDTF